jgi:hypothetical protein
MPFLLSALLTLELRREKRASVFPSILPRLVLQHVLPRGFQRVWDYGFLHGNAKRFLNLVQLILRVMIESNPPRPKPVFKYPCCKAVMLITAFRRPAWAAG